MGTSCCKCFFEENKKNIIIKEKNKNIIDNTSLLLNHYKKNKVKSVGIKIKIKENKQYDSEKLTEISIETNEKKGIIVKNIYKLNNKKKKTYINKEKINESKDNNLNNKKTFMKGDKIDEDKFGEIFVGISIKNGDIFIVKIYNKILDIQKKKIIQNLDILYKLNHKNILKALPILEDNIFDENGDLAIAYESINIENLEKNINKYGYWNETLLQKILKQLLEGIKYLHEKNFYHKNLKASNIYLDSNGTIKISNYLIDNIILGNAKNIYDNLLKSDEINYYIPPFFIRAINEYNSNNINNNNDEIFNDWKSYDLWFLGCLIIELFSKKKPWSDYNFKNNSEFFDFLGKTKLIPNIPRKLSRQCHDLLKILLNYSETKKPNIYDIIFDLDYFKLDISNFTYFSVVESKGSNDNKNKSLEYSKLFSSKDNLVNIINSRNNASYSASFTEEEKNIFSNNIKLMNSFSKLNKSFYYEYKSFYFKLNASIYHKYNNKRTAISEVKEVEIEQSPQKSQFLKRKNNLFL